MVREVAITEAAELKQEMNESCIKDSDAIKSKKPAFNKLMVARTLYTRLKKRETESQFMEQDGLDMFA